MRKVWMTVMAVGLGIGALGACSSDSYNRDDLIKELEDSGVPSDVANCIADGVEGRIDVKALENQDELTAEQEQVLTEITTECMLGTPIDGGDTTE